MDSSYDHTKCLTMGLYVNDKMDTLTFPSQLAAVLAVTCRDTSCTAKSHHQTPKLLCISYPFMVLAIAQLSNIPPGKDINSAYYSTMFLADLSHARMWASRDLTRWTSEKVAR